MEKTVDARGESCPMPILKLARAAREAVPGTVLRLLATDPAVEPDVQAGCAATGNELLRVSREGQEWVAAVRIPANAR